MASRAPSRYNNESTTSFDDLPPETTTNIFLRLPVKTLIRSTSVNKTWYSIITDPYFISAQIRRSVSFCHENAVLIVPPCISQQKSYCSLISADTSSIIEKFEIPFDTKSRSLKLVAQVDGLVLLTDLHLHYTSRDLYLWNPYVKRHRVLISGCFKKLLNKLEKSRCIVGMGFHKETNDYRVVRVVYVTDDNGKRFGDVAPKVEIYSLRKNTWRKIKDAVVPIFAWNDGTYVNGSFYWLEFRQPLEALTNSKEVRILSFDFDNEVFGELKLPDDVPAPLKIFAPFKLMEFEGSLSLCVLDVKVSDRMIVTGPCRIWLMRQENGVVSWTLRFRAVLKEAVCPVNITKNGTLIIESIRLRRPDVIHLVSCNLKSMNYKDLAFANRGGGEDSRFVLAPYTVDTSFPESLIMYGGGKSLLNMQSEQSYN